jgi:hypothetical protein
VAGALIAQIEAAARAAGAGGIVIITGFDNAGAQAAYRASGYANWALAMQKHFPKASCLSRSPACTAQRSSRGWSSHSLNSMGSATTGMLQSLCSSTNRAALRLQCLLGVRRGTR